MASKKRRPKLPQCFNTRDRGRCRWCGELIYEPNNKLNLRRRWHKECVFLYNIATKPSMTRAFVRKRDGRVCACCHKLCAERDWSVDHINRLADSGGDPKFWHPHNLQTLCNKCHKEKTAYENAKARRGDGTG